MKIGFLGACHEVTGSCHYLEVNGINILIDCGMEQGADIYENQEIPVEAEKINYVFVTHAHIDHSGLIPLLYKNGFRGSVYATNATTQLCEIMLKDSAHIQESEAEWKNRKAIRNGLPLQEPMYEMADAEGVLSCFIPCTYNTKIDICKEVTARFIDAGHLLGSSSIELWLRENNEERKVVFSGDIGTKSRPLIKAPHYINEADYVIMESTYGNRLHDNPPDFAMALANTIDDTMKRGGNVVIPAFSVGRTQEILYFIRRIKEEGLCKAAGNFPVYMDSPLAIEATNIFKESVSECFNEEANSIIKAGKNPIGFDNLNLATSSEDSKAINEDKTPKVIISASGMCEAGRIRHHLKHNLWRGESSICFVGYQVPGTLGHILLNGAKNVKLFGESIAVNAHIEKLPGMSGHADNGGLIEWVQAFNNEVKRVFIVHGEDSVVDIFAESVNRATGFSTVAPYSGDVFDLITGEQIKAGDRIRVQQSSKKKAASNIFMRLRAAGDRLLRVIFDSEGMANKDLAKFADQINSLCDKWSRK